MGSRPLPWGVGVPEDPPLPGALRGYWLLHWEGGLTFCGTPVSPPIKESALDLGMELGS